MRFAFRNAGWTKHMNIISQPPKTMTTSHNDQAPLGPYTADKYTRGADYTANTAQREEDSYILALPTDLEYHKRVTALRSQYFPPGLNKLSAPIALFRALPGSQLATSHGVAIHANAPPARGIYKGLKDKWGDLLSKQDKSFKAHYTIQNEVEDGVPQRTLEELQTDVEGSRGQGDGLSLYRYDRGHWRHMRVLCSRIRSNRNSASSETKRSKGGTRRASHPDFPKGNSTNRKRHEFAILLKGIAKTPGLRAHQIKMRLLAERGDRESPCR
ncbi:MAG: hypothetical protein Q9175_005203 [Cornicularia normoerica]